MSFIAAAAKTAAPYIKTAAPYISAGTSIIAGQQASAVGQYNQDIQNRNAQVAEQEENRLEEQNKFDLANFNNQFYQLQGETRTNILFSGADLSGSGLRILKYNAEQAQVEKDILSYNSQVAQSQKSEEANFARMRGTLAKQEAKAAEFGYYAQAGTSLLKAFG
jgi:hypothetical protein